MAKKDCPLPPGSKVWAYLRVSGDEQADRGLPIAGQRQQAELYAQQHQLIITRWFIDEAKSGGSTIGRDAFNEMVYLSRQKPRPVDGIIIWDLKRFARNLLDSQFYKADLRRRGFQLIFLSDDIPETDFAPVYEALLEWKAEKDRADIAKDARRGLQQLARLGYAPGGFPPRGYKAETLTIEIEGRKRQVRRWIPDPETWHLARKAWEMRAAGASLEEIFRETKLFRSQGCFSSFFANKTYLGIRKCGDLEIENAHEPLITQEIWDKVQQLRRSYSQLDTTHHPRRKHSRYLLTGLLYCAECGAAMCGSYSPQREKANDGYPRSEWRFYICSRKTRQNLGSCPSSRIKADLIEQAILSTLLQDILTTERLLQLLQETNQALNNRYENLLEQHRRLQYELARLEDRINHLLDALEQGESIAIRERLREREAERVQLLSAIAAISEEMKQVHIELSPAALHHLIENMHRILKGDDIHAMRALLRTFIVRIEVSRHRALMYYTFPFAPAPTGI